MSGNALATMSKSPDTPSPWSYELVENVDLNTVVWTGRADYFDLSRKNGADA
jgi:hypothetical protein